MIWFGTNGTIKNSAFPDYIDLKLKCKNFSNSNHFLPIKLHSTWSITMSIIGVSFLCFNDSIHNKNNKI